MTTLDYTNSIYNLLHYIYAFDANFTDYFINFVTKASFKEQLKIRRREIIPELNEFCKVVGKGSTFPYKGL